MSHTWYGEKAVVKGVMKVGLHKRRGVASAAG
jgi:hypothetical protein